MSLVDSKTLSPEILESVRSKLQNATSPLKLAEVAKGLNRPKKLTAPDFQLAIASFLKEQVRIGQAFCYHSGKSGAERFWSKDEKHLLRDKALEITASPLTLSDLKKLLAKEVAGVDGAFVETVLRELIGDAKLFEHPPNTKKGSPRFGIAAPPPPIPSLEQPKHKKSVDKLIADIQKVSNAANVSAGELMRVLSERLMPSEIAKNTFELGTKSNGFSGEVEEKSGNHTDARSIRELEELILKVIANSAVVSLADLRDGMPIEFRGRVFDDTILHMVDEQRLSVFSDAEASGFSQTEREKYVQDGSHVYTSTARRN